MTMSDSLSHKATALVGVVLGSAILLAGCEQQGPAERAGRAMDESAERAEQYMNEERDDASQSLQNSQERQFIEGENDSLRD